MVRTALRQQQWSLVLSAIEQLPDQLRQANEWTYWQARALDQLGMDALAKEKMEKLATERSYYGFMAADYLGWPYRMNDSSEMLIKGDIKDLQGLQKLNELRAVGLDTWARREWQHMLNHLGSEQKQMAAMIAHEAGWHDLVFMTAGDTGLEDNLQLRFPTAYRETVEKAVSEHAIDPAWVMGVMRRESAFRPDARSSSGAMGLMQVMPATGRQVARTLKAPIKKINELFGVERNIEIGSAYLQSLNQRFNQNMVLATAAYNAGPHKVSQWLPPHEGLPADVWIDTIPYRETREYTRAVISYAVVFSWRLRGEVFPLRDRVGMIAMSAFEGN
jgi:soluble lytic murein transglycosylase